MANNKNKQSNINLFPILAAAVVVVCVVVVLVMNGRASNSTTAIDDNRANDADQGSENASEIARDNVDDQNNKGTLDAVTETKNTEADYNPVVIGQGESLVIPVSDITEEATFYPIEVDGTSMEVFAIKASDGTIRTAFNTCQSCYTSGAGFYTMQGEDLVCNNCGFHFSPDQVEVSAGGCNPWPIYPEDKTVADDTITISYDFLSESKDIFANWKTAMNE